MRTVTDDPLWVTVPFHNWVIVCPFANVQVTVHELRAVLPLVTLTFAWKPVFHWLTTVYAAVQPPGGGGEAGLDGGFDGGFDGGRDEGGGFDGGRDDGGGGE